MFNQIGNKRGNVNTKTNSKILIFVTKIIHVSKLFLSLLFNSVYYKQQLIKEKSMKISPTLQRGIKAAEVATIETAKGLAGYAVTKDPLMTATAGKFLGDSVEIGVRSIVGYVMMEIGHQERGVKLALGNPLNVLSDLLTLYGTRKNRESFHSGKELFKDIAKEMWKKPY